MHRYGTYEPQVEDLNTTAGFVFSRLRPGDRVLDLGCGPGLLAKELTRREFTVLAVDNDPAALAELQANGVEHRRLDLEAEPLDSLFGHREFDVVLLCDVLEHLRDPASLLERLNPFHHKFREVLVTLPNVSYLGVVLNLLRDRFEYTETGILDRTHLRFFTKDSFPPIVDRAGFKVEAYHPIRLPLPTQEFPFMADDLLPEGLDLATLAALNPSLETYQHCFALGFVRPVARSARFVPGLLSVVVRTIDDRLDFLDTALFSLACQDYRQLEIVVVYQGLSEAYRSKLDSLLDSYRSDGLAVRLIGNPTDGDERARNLNLGLAEAKGQYVAFLDDDDVVYPEHYTELIALLEKEGAAWGYSDVYQANCKRDANGNVYVFGYERPFAHDAYRFVDHWLDNFIPIHSFVVDRERVPDHLLRFDETFDRAEDYAFLLRLASEFRPAYHPKFTCEYRIRYDGSNSTVTGTMDEEILALKTALWEAARSKLHALKRQLQPSQYLAEIFDHTYWLHIERGRLAEQNLRIKATFGCSPDENSFEKPLRYVVADRLNSVFKRLHWLHRALKTSTSVARRIFRPAKSVA
ncbi:MAG: methyltransferase domain-containing protein [Cyanobacteria bacterium REEB65]|nr:methyltransferase domain-containing protein [Cyanobacteria bacterium REEB65]